MNEKVQAAFSSAHYNARTPILHSFHLSWHLGTFILFKGLTLVKIEKKKPQKNSNICTRIWVLSYYFSCFVFKIVAYRIFVFVRHFEVNDDLFCFCVFVSYVWMEMKKLFSQRSTNTSVIINRQTCTFSISYLMVRFQNNFMQHVKDK